MADVDVAGLRAHFTAPHELLRASDGKTLFLRRWTTGGDARATVLIFHGITAYSEPYGPLVAAPLAAAGYDVYGMDLRGHGLSDGRRGDYPSAERLAKDLGETVAFVKARSRRVVVLGHSLGALSAILATKQRPSDVSGVILLGAARRFRSGVYPRPRAGQIARQLLAVTILRSVPLIDYRREGMVGQDDPLFTFRYSARFYSAMYGAPALRVARWFRSGVVDSPNLSFGGPLRVPLLVGIGDQDELFSVEAAKDFCDEIEAGDRQFLVVPGAHHATVPRDGFGPVLGWLGERVGPTPVASPSAGARA